MKRNLFFWLPGLLSMYGAIFANDSMHTSVSKHVSIVGGGIVGALESYYAYQDAVKNGEKICITVFEKNESFDHSSQGLPSTNTAPF